MSEKRYRASEAPIAMLCAGSVNAPDDEILIDSVNPAGIVGTAVHACCKWMVDNNAWPLWEVIVQPYGLSPAQMDEVRYLVGIAWKWWQSYGRILPGAKTEVPLKSGQWSGHVDVLHVDDEAVVERQAIEIDWKTTRLDIDYTAQHRFYASLIFANYGGIDGVKTMTVFLRDQTVDIKWWDLEQIRAFTADYYDKVMNWDGRTYTPGGHCAYCRRFLGCPARGAMVQRTSSELGFNPEGDLADFYKRLQVVEVLAKKAREQVRAMVEQAGGELPGMKLVPSSRDTINARAAWPVLTEIMEPDQFADAVTINKGSLLDAYAATVPKGKGKAKKELMEALKEAGAVTTSTFTTLRVVQNNQQEVELVGTNETE